MSKEKVLFISPAFFGYELSIKNAILENGYEVDYFDERPSNNALMKALGETEQANTQKQFLADALGLNIEEQV